jgi:uncharacterized protein (DUF2249 family)
MKQEYQQLLDKYKDKEVGSVKLLKRGDNDVLIKPSQQEVLTAESHPPPSRQYTRVIQKPMKFEAKEYQEGDTVWMWGTKKGEPMKQEYQQLLDKYKDKEVGSVKLLKRGDNDVLIKPSQQEVLTAESHPPPSRQYTRVIQEPMKFEAKEYQEGDTVWMWGTKKGEPNNVKGSAKFWLRPFRIIMKSVNDAYYLSTLEGRKRPLPDSGCLLKHHHGAET